MTINLYSGRPRMGLSVNNQQKIRQAVVKISFCFLNQNGLTIGGLIFMTEEEKFLTVKSLKPGPGILK